ncbi:MAG: cation:proton antiporter domain-containing protein [Akkermansiaceae bacterium]
MNEQLFFNGFIYLLAAALAAPLGRRFGVGAVLGYLFIGAIVGPASLGWVGENQEEVMHFAEFGVVLMLFVIGLEINLSRLWKMRGPILGLGGLQVGLTTLVLAAAALLLNINWQEALAMGMILSLSSTAIVMQTLRERGIMDTSAGEQSFAVLLFQALGHPEDHVHDAKHRFLAHEVEAIKAAAPHYHDEKTYIGIAQQNLKDLDSLLLNAPLKSRD